MKLVCENTVKETKDKEINDVKIKQDNKIHRLFKHTQEENGRLHIGECTVVTSISWCPSGDESFSNKSSLIQNKVRLSGNQAYWRKMA